MTASLAQAIVGLTIGWWGVDAPAHAALEVYRWENPKGAEAPLDLAPGASTDLWTSNGLHYRSDGQQLGELAFKKAAPSRELWNVASDGSGGVVVVSRVEKAVSLSRHDQEGRELWSVPIGRPRRQNTKGNAAPDEILAASVTGISADGTIDLGGWLQGCVDLTAGGPRRRLVCATRRNAGEPTSPEQDAYPRVFFVNQYDQAGAWKRALVFEKLPRASAASSRAGLIAVTGRWYTDRDVELRAPGGEALLRVPANKQPGVRLKSILGLFQPDGRAMGVAELDAAEYAVARSLAFDESDRLWSLVELSPQLDLKEAGQTRLTVPGGHCLGLLSRTDSASGWRANLVRCARPDEGDPFSKLLFVASATEGRLILGNLPATMGAAVTLGSADGPERARSGQDLTLMVLSNGRASWSLRTSGVNHAVGLAQGWACFTQLNRITCIRPARKG